MKLIMSIHSRQLLFASVLVAVLMITLANPYSALAGRSGCRGDPLVVLLDGTTIQIVSAIGTDLNDVQRIDYVVHVPTGSRVVSIVYTDSLIGIHEHLDVVADLPARHYTTDTVVTTGLRNATVTTTSRLVRVLGLDDGSASGYSSRHLRVELSSWL